MSNRKPPNRGALHLHEGQELHCTYTKGKSWNPVQVQISLSQEIFYMFAVTYYLQRQRHEKLVHFSE